MHVSAWSPYGESRAVAGVNGPPHLLPRAEACRETGAHDESRRPDARVLRGLPGRAPRRWGGSIASPPATHTSITARRSRLSDACAPAWVSSPWRWSRIRYGCASRTGLRSSATPSSGWASSQHGSLWCCLTPWSGPSLCSSGSSTPWQQSVASWCSPFQWHA